jgi:hypothetical protein
MGRGTRWKGPAGGHKGPHSAPHHSRPYGLTSTFPRNILLCMAAVKQHWRPYGLTSTFPRNLSVKALRQGEPRIELRNILVHGQPAPDWMPGTFKVPVYLLPFSLTLRTLLQGKRNRVGHSPARCFRVIALTCFDSFLVTAPLAAAWWVPGEMRRGSLPDCSAGSGVCPRQSTGAAFHTPGSG